MRSVKTTAGSTASTEDRTDRLIDYVADALGASSSEVSIERLAAGHSNLTYVVRCAAAAYVLRRPPFGPLPPSAHDVIREFRVLRLLEGRGARTPRPLLACEDVDVIGAPFYLMERVEGTVLRGDLPGNASDELSKEAVCAEIIDALVELHTVDWRAAGFDSIASGEGYLGRQLLLWKRQWRHNSTRSLDQVDAVGDWLDANRPAESAITVVHGDYKIDNIIFDLDAEPPRARAIVDWEMATLGDPLADLGFLTAVWSEPGEDPDTLMGLSRVTAQLPSGSRAKMTARYAERTGRDLRGISWYQTLALWKLAILLEGSYKRHLAGTTDDAWLASLAGGVPRLLDRAFELSSQPI
jgi:aminoglycoside phosphotransferase (APT) family kinase protein